MLCLQKEKRTVTQSVFGEMAFITWLPALAPDVQALPPLAQILFISKLKRSISERSDFGKFTLNKVYKLLPDGSPLKVADGIRFF